MFDALTSSVEHITAGKLRAVGVFADLSKLKHANTWQAYLAPLRKSEWVVYAKKPYAGPQQVLAYLARYTHRVAISNSRLLDLDATHVSFRWKDYRENGRHRSKVMRLDVAEFMRRFLLHVLPTGFHRIRHSSRRQARTLSTGSQCAIAANRARQQR
jgi:hypothetical protein